MEAAVPAFTSGYLPLASGFDCYFESSGQGEIPLVFVPGWSMSTEVFEHQRSHYASSVKVTFFAFDPRGQGRSSKPTDGHNYQQHGRDLNAFLSALRLDKVVLVGWSFGVLDVLSYVRQFGTGGLRALVLLDGTPMTAGSDSSSEWIWVGNDNWYACNRDFSLLMTTDQREKTIEMFIESILDAPTPEHANRLLSIFGQTPGWIAALTNASGTAERFDDTLADLEGKLPLLYVMAKDHWFPAVENWSTANTPSAQIVRLGNHLFFWQRPTEFNAVLDAFVSELSRVDDPQPRA